jgi:Cytochrome P450
MRRASLSNFFSKASIAKIEPLIVHSVSVLCEQIEILASKQQPVKLSSAFSCLTADIVHQFAFSKSPHFLLYPDFETPFSRAFKFAFSSTAFTKHTPWLFPVMDSISRLAARYIAHPCLTVLRLPFFKPTSDMGWVAQWRKVSKHEDSFAKELNKSRKSEPILTNIREVSKITSLPTLSAWTSLKRFSAAIYHPKKRQHRDSPKREVC